GSAAGEGAPKPTLPIATEERHRSICRHDLWSQKDFADLLPAFKESMSRRGLTSGYDGQTLESCGDYRRRPDKRCWVLQRFGHVGHRREVPNYHIESASRRRQPVRFLVGSGIVVLQIQRKRTIGVLFYIVVTA